VTPPTGPSRRRTRAGGCARSTRSTSSSSSAACARATRGPACASQAQFDAELDRFERLDVDLRARSGPSSSRPASASTLPDDPRHRRAAHATWPDVARLETRGIEWLPPAVFGHEVEPRVRQLSVQLREDRARAAGRWELGWRATLDPALDETGRRDTRFEARVALLQENLGPWFVSVEGLGEWALADDRQPEAFLRRASLVFGADVAERFGVQGRLSYQATYDRCARSWAAAS
jgi:hypothetical protein